MDTCAEAATPAATREVCDCPVDAFPVGNVTDGWRIGPDRTELYLMVRCPNHPRTTRTITLPRR